jgi:hypothetical protein
MRLAPGGFEWLCRRLKKLADRKLREAGGEIG